MRAYRDLFGADESSRSETQRIVWDDLKVAGYFKQPVFIRDHTGALCPLRAAYADGRRSIFLYIERNAMFTPELTEEQPKGETRHG